MTPLTSINELLATLEPINDRMKTIAIGLMGVFFVVALIHDHFNGIQGESERVTILFKAVLFFAFLAAYRPFFENVNKIGSGISTEIFSEADFSSFVGDIWTGMNQAQQSLDGIWGVLKGGMTTLVITFSYLLAVLAYKVLQIAKLVTMGLLYVIGPLLLSGSVLPGGGRLTVSLARNVISVAAWPILGNVMLRLLKEIGIAGYGANPEQFVPLLAANFTFAFSLMMVPALCSALIGGGTMGPMGSIVGLSTLSMAISPVTYSWSRVRDFSVKHGIRRAGGALASLTHAVKDKVTSRPGDRISS